MIAVALAGPTGVPSLAGLDLAATTEASHRVFEQIVGSGHSSGLKSFATPMINPVVQAFQQFHVIDRDARLMFLHLHSNIRIKTGDEKGVNLHCRL